MKGILYGKFSGSMLVLGAFAVWVFSMRLIPQSWEYQFAASSGVAAAAFFLAACFLPDRRPVIFLSRRSALGAMAFFLWFGSMSFMRVAFQDQTAPGEAWRPFLMLILPFAIPYTVYHLSQFLIRGFRAAPEVVLAELSRSDTDAAPARIPPVKP